MRRLVEGDAVFESVYDSFRGPKTHDVVQGRVLEAEIHECNTSSVARGDAGDVPRGLRRPRQIVRDRDERDQCRVVDERRNQVPEPRERQLTGGRHCPGW